MFDRSALWDKLEAFPEEDIFLILSLIVIGQEHALGKITGAFAQHFNATAFAIAMLCHSSIKPPLAYLPITLIAPLSASIGLSPLQQLHC